MLVRSMLFALSALVVSISQFTAASPPHVFDALRRASGVFARQNEPFNIDRIPAPCRPRCANIVNTIRTCTTVQCLCTTQAENDFVNCLTCLVALGPAPEVVAQAQLSIDQYLSNCAASNISLPPIKLTPDGTTSVAPTRSGSGSETFLTVVFPTGSSMALPSITRSALSDSTTGMTMSSVSHGAATTIANPPSPPSPSASAFSNSNAARQNYRRAVWSWGTGLVTVVSVSVFLVL